MKKLFSIVSSLILVSTITAYAEIGMGISGTFISIDGDGTETTSSSGEKNTGSHSEEVGVPELFIEAVTDNGGAFGISYIPTRELGSKSRTDTSDGTGSESGTYKAEAELDNVIQVYADIPVIDAYGALIYGKVGVQHATITTLESLNSGSTYPDEDVMGLTIGIGAKGDLNFGNNLYYKAEVTYTDFEDYEADSTSDPSNRVEAELEDTAVKFSIGYKF